MSLPGFILICLILTWSKVVFPENMPAMKETVKSSTPTLSDRLHNHVSHLALKIGQRNILHLHALNAAAAYIHNEWTAQGYQVKVQYYQANGVQSKNLEVSRIGTTKPHEIILVGAHYDTVEGSPGANDNASGIAALLELSRFFATVETERTLRFVAFTNEESPFFFWGQMGSTIYAQQAKARNENIRLMISLEMLGSYSEKPGSQSYPLFLKYFYPDRANFIAMVSNLASRKELNQLVLAFKSHSDFPLESLATFEFIPGVAWSDHLSFWREGYPAVMVTDTAFYRYEAYHTEKDTPEKLNYSAMAQVAEGLFHALRTLKLPK
ncbi:M28 family peptidase [Nitrosomonas sp. Nm33]|uniref:M28 family peptidase n=1 Tax=Nitrosomonas sp. Nm33 TaxID=133724 RepID=UPI00089D1309|nr:M28 family peptidase [Nitrosomonas sp. Nm33]SDX99115.1 Zn-dependent amino-or carboxypeptidase, M28 family [Nitrosomonas sp. Nm33]